MLAAQIPERKPHRGKAAPVEALAEPTKAPSLNDLAKEALRQNDNDVRSASNHLYEQLSHNPAELERIAKMPPWLTRKEFKIVRWHFSQKTSLEDTFNELSVAGYKYAECLFNDGLRAEYIFSRDVPREKV